MHEIRGVSGVSTKYGKKQECHTYIEKESSEHTYIYTYIQPVKWK